MRINDISQRLNLQKKDMWYYFNNEYAYYKNNNVRQFELYGKKINALYKNINVQVVMTKACPFDCPFCVEKVNPISPAAGTAPVDGKKGLILRLCQSLYKSGCNPTFSITGGEPMLYPQDSIEIQKFICDLGYKVNINTCGIVTDKNIMDNFERINLSVHDSNPLKNSKIFGGMREKYWEEFDPNTTTIQKVLNLPCTGMDLGTFILHLPKFKRFSFRLPTQSLDEKNWDWTKFMETIPKYYYSSSWKFLQQKIGDYYFYEDWMWANKHIHISYSSIQQLREYKIRGDNFVRAIIICPDNTIQYDWVN